MHVPDGFLDLKTVAATYAASGIAGAYAAARARGTDDDRVPLLGILAAFVFAAQMVNFPVLYGTSGHVIGGFLAAVLVGPWAGFFVTASVLFVQALFFQDGGLAAYGANLLNMGVIGTMGAYWIFVGLTRVLRSPWAAVAVAAWSSVFLAAIACAVELWASGHVALRVVLPAMAGVHALIGVGEAVVTTGVLRAIAKVRPDILAFLAPPAEGVVARGA